MLAIGGAADAGLKSRRPIDDCFVQRLQPKRLLRLQHRVVSLQLRRRPRKQRAAQDDVFPSGGVEQRDEIRDDTEHRGLRVDIDEAVNAHESDRSEAWNRRVATMTAPGKVPSIEKSCELCRVFTASISSISRSGRSPTTAEPQVREVPIVRYTIRPRGNEACGLVSCSSATSIERFRSAAQARSRS